MRFLVDAQLPPALARWLVAKSFDAEHVGDCGLATASDAEIWDYALRSGSIILTKDDDFAQRKGLENGGPTIVWIRLPNTRTRDLLIWFENALPVVLDALAHGETLIEMI
jgi:predicted nuclease of predicted toxin-antitoxin system